MTITACQCSCCRKRYDFTFLSLGSSLNTTNEKILSLQQQVDDYEKALELIKGCLIGYFTERAIATCDETLAKYKKEQV